MELVIIAVSPQLITVPECFETLSSTLLPRNKSTSSLRVLEKLFVNKSFVSILTKCLTGIVVCLLCDSNGTYMPSSNQSLLYQIAWLPFGSSHTWSPNTSPRQVQLGELGWVHQCNYFSQSKLTQLEVDQSFANACFDVYQSTLPRNPFLEGWFLCSQKQ